LNRELERIAYQVWELTRAFGSYATADNLPNASGWLLLFVQKLDTISNQLEHISEQLTVQSVQDEVDKTSLQTEVEARFGKPIVVLMAERRDQSVRSIAEELGVGRSTVSSWRHQLGL
jgi:hypothetical protein